ncbi:MAG TPA: glucose-6-phosphate isomerase [Clostridiales bacterium]|nr:glucose-6-phosphate isomerase [Clostridiales bacterium]
MAFTVNVKNASGFAPALAEREVLAAHETLVNGTGRGNDFLGWVRLPLQNNEEELARIEAAAAKIRSNSQVLLVIGIGGSYLGARAAIEFVRSPNYNLVVKDSPQVIFAGNTLSAWQTAEIFDMLEGKDVSVNVISKSGTTTEPAVAFRLFREYMEKKYGVEGAKERIYATTDKAKGALKSLADANGYPCFVIPDDVGGRFSVLTPVGLLPIAVAGIDIRQMLAGAKSMAEKLIHDKSMHNPAWVYAATRNALYRKGYTTEIFASYEPRVRYTAEWWKQLYGESEGKEGKGIFPASVELTADLHSMGQYIQEGERFLMETVVGFAEADETLQVPFALKNEDGLNFLAGHAVSELNNMAEAGTILAHMDGGVPVMEVTVDNASAYCFGELVYFFEFACGLSGYLLGVNPFDQPGVEAYKQNMYALIGKPGFEDRRAELEKRL